MVIKGGGVEGRSRSGERGQIKDVLTETVFRRHTQHVQRFCVSFKAGSVLCPGTFEMQTSLWKFTDISFPYCSVYVNIVWYSQIEDSPIFS